MTEKHYTVGGRPAWSLRLRALRGRCLRVNLRRAKIALHEQLHRLGFDVVPYSAAYFSNKLRARTIQQLGVTAVLDVGANAGQFAREIRSDGWSGLVVSIEPLPGAYEALARAAYRDPLWSTVNVAAGSAAGSVGINVSANAWSSSIFPITERHLDFAPDAHLVGSEQVRMETLDSIVTDLQLGRETFFLKADTQGYELEVLAGASATLERTVVVEVELSLIELYEGQPLISDVVRRLLDLGFVPIDFAPNVYANHAIIQINGLFVRNGIATPQRSGRDTRRRATESQRGDKEPNQAALVRELSLFQRFAAMTMGSNARRLRCECAPGQRVARLLLGALSREAGFQSPMV